MSTSSAGSPCEEITVFSTLPGQFPDVESRTPKIKTQEFLLASTGVVTLVEKFGKVFAPVIYDMNGNIRKISVKYEEDKEKYEFIEDMILTLKNTGQLQVIDALQWLRRALHFMTCFFQSVIEDSQSNRAQDLSPFIKKAYRETLERYHGWLGAQLFNILSKCAPSRKNLFYHLALDKHNMEQTVLPQMTIFTRKMELCVLKLIDFYNEHDLETNNRV